jgi:hypothetical protein
MTMFEFAPRAASMIGVEEDRGSRRVNKLIESDFYQKAIFKCGL